MPVGARRCAFNAAAVEDFRHRSRGQVERARCTARTQVCAVRRHEDLDGFVVIAVGALVERTLDAADARNDGRA
jgi:hypothetical protein